MFFFARYILLFFLIHHVHSIQEKQSETKSIAKNKISQQDLTLIKYIISRKVDDYYGILGVPKNARPDQIEDAFRKLLVRVHPDKNKAQDAKIATQRVVYARSELLKRLGRTSSSTYFQQSN